MVKQLIAILFSILLILFAACKSSEEEYMKVATDHFNKEEYEKSIENYKKVLQHYPDGDNASKAMFMIAFTYANNLENFEEAKKYYNMFLEKYPDHELASSARYELENMGKDINELPIFKKMEEDQESDAQKTEKE